MFDFFLGCILDKSPDHRWSHLIKELSLLFFFHSLYVILISFTAMHLFLIVYSLSLIKFNKLIDINIAHMTKSLKDNMIFDVFKNVFVNIFEDISGFDPFLFIFFIEVSFIHPKTAISLNLFIICICLLLLF